MNEKATWSGRPLKKKMWPETTSRQTLRDMLIQGPSRREANMQSGSKRRLVRHERVGEPSLVGGDPIPNRNLSAGCGQPRGQSGTKTRVDGSSAGNDGMQGGRRRH